MIGCAAALLAGAVALLIPAPAKLGRLEPLRRHSQISRFVLGPSTVVSLPVRRWTGLSVAVLVSLLAGQGWPFVAPLAGVSTFVVLGYVESGTQRRRDALVAQQLPDALDLLVAALAAGLPLPWAVAAVSDVSPSGIAEELGIVARRIEVGTSVEEAWGQSAGRPVVGPIMRDIARSARSGAALVDTLQRHASQARRRAEASRIVAAKAVGVRSVFPLMVCFLPAFILLGIVPIVASTLAQILR